MRPGVSWGVLGYPWVSWGILGCPGVIRPTHIIMFSEFKIAIFLFFRERICSPKEFAPLRMLYLLLKEFAPLRIFCRFVFT